MTAQGLNVCAGIDAGSGFSKLAYSDNLGVRVIASSEGTDFLTLREEAEIFFDDIVSSCVIAVNDDLTSRQKESLKLKANEAGFSDAEIINASEAIILALNDEAKILVCDLGASAARFFVVNGREILDNVVIDTGGDMLDRFFAEYLAERKLIGKIDGNIIKEAKRIKHILSDNESRLWHNVNIFREDLERLIYFTVKRASHTFSRLKHVWKPERVILTGGCVKIPLVREFFGGKNSQAIEGLIVKGAAMSGKKIKKHEKQGSKPNTVTKIHELKAEILRLEEGLTRQQKDRLYILFRQAEGINDTGLTALIENLISEIKNA